MDQQTDGGKRWNVRRNAVFSVEGRAVGDGSSFYRKRHTGRAIFAKCDIAASQ
jgi:hypothetical protein